MLRLPRQATALLALVLSAVAACSQTPSVESPSEQEPENVLHAEVASYDIAAGEPTRLIVGLFTGDELFVSYGTVDMAFSFLGDADAARPAEPGPTARGRFLLVPGTEIGRTVPEHPVAVPASKGRGVYAAEVALDRPGFWEVAVTVDVDGRGPMTATSAFEVLDEHRIPAPGDAALKTENLTRDSANAPHEAVDSRWRSGERLPDPGLHSTTIAQTVRAGRPAIVVFSTPVYCVSRFCGPVTDMVQDLAHEYGDRAAFIHVEIWRNYEKKVINRAAADWLLRDNDLREPWVFFIGADGRIKERWDNVATREELEPLLQELPRVSRKS